MLNPKYIKTVLMPGESRLNPEWLKLCKVTFPESRIHGSVSEINDDKIVVIRQGKTFVFSALELERQGRFINPPPNSKIKKFLF